MITKGVVFFFEKERKFRVDLVTTGLLDRGFKNLAQKQGSNEKEKSASCYMVLSVSGKPRRLDLTGKACLKRCSESPVRAVKQDMPSTSCQAFHTKPFRVPGAACCTNCAYSLKYGREI